MVKTISVMINSMSVKPCEEEGRRRKAEGSRLFLLLSAFCLLLSAFCLFILLHRQAADDRLQFHRATIRREDLRAHGVKAEEAFACRDSFNLEVEDDIRAGLQGRA